MKRTIVTLVVMLIAPLAFAQTSSTHKRQATTTEPITVTGTIIPTPEEGSCCRLSACQNARCPRGQIESSRALCSQRTWSRCGQVRKSRPNRDQTWHSRACLLHKHWRFAYG